MDVHINSEPEEVPDELKRSVDEYFPDFEAVTVAGQKQGRVVMAVGTRELRRSNYASAQVQYQWLYFHPEGARAFARLLTQMAEEVESRDEYPDYTPPTFG